MQKISCFRWKLAEKSFSEVDYLMIAFTPKCYNFPIVHWVAPPAHQNLTTSSTESSGAARTIQEWCREKTAGKGRGVEAMEITDSANKFHFDLMFPPCSADMTHSTVSNAGRKKWEKFWFLDSFCRKRAQFKPSFTHQVKTWSSSNQLKFQTICQRRN